VYLGCGIGEDEQHGLLVNEVREDCAVIATRLAAIVRGSEELRGRRVGL
jgi:hypothetical protein